MFFAAAAASTRVARPVSAARPLASMLSRGLATQTDAPTSAYNKQKDADGKYTVTRERLFWRAWWKA